MLERVLGSSQCLHLWISTYGKVTQVRPQLWSQHCTLRDSVFLSQSSHLDLPKIHVSYRLQESFLPSTMVHIFNFSIRETDICKRDASLVYLASSRPASVTVRRLCVCVYVCVCTHVPACSSLNVCLCCPPLCHTHTHTHYFGGWGWKDLLPQIFNPHC